MGKMDYNGGKIKFLLVRKERSSWCRKSDLPGGKTAIPCEERTIHHGEKVTTPPVGKKRSLWWRRTDPRGYEATTIGWRAWCFSSGLTPHWPLLPPSPTLPFPLPLPFPFTAWFALSSPCVPGYSGEFELDQFQTHSLSCNACLLDLLLHRDTLGLPSKTSLS